MKKKILIYAHYYVPDVASTGQILQEQAEGMSSDFDVTVICTVPSYSGVVEEKYKKKKAYFEKINGIKVIRLSVPEFSKKSKLSRIRNLLAYFTGAMKMSRRLGNFDYVFTISQPPILGGMLGLYGKRKIRTEKGENPRFIYCIQDFNPEQIEATGYVKMKPLISLCRWLDKRTCRKSDLVITVGRDLVETLKKRFDDKNVPKHVMINNWIDEKKIYPLPADNTMVEGFRKKYGLSGKYVIMYSGNIGLYYDLEGLIKVMAHFKNAVTNDGREVAFVFVGSGSVMDRLVAYKKKHKLENVIFLPYQDKEMLVYSINAADVHWCVNAKGIKGVSCPSKFYGIAAAAKPVLGVLESGSEIEMLINDTGCGLCCEPGDYKNVEKNIRWFIENAGSNEIREMGKRGYDYLTSHLTKDISVSKYISSIKDLE